MAIKYGSNTVKSSGSIVGGDGQNSGRTLYFYNSSGADWNTLGNWWLDKDHTIPSPSLPTDEDTAVILSDITSNSGSFIADTIIFDSGNLDFSNYSIGEVRKIILKNTSYIAGYGNLGSESGTKIEIYCYDSSRLYPTNSCCITIYGNLYLYESSYIDSNNNYLIDIYGDVFVNSVGNSYQPIYGNSSYAAEIRGNLKVVGSSSTVTIRSVRVYGTTELFNNVRIEGSSSYPSYFYGPVTLNKSCIINDYINFYNDVTLYESSYIEGDTSVYFYSYSSAAAASFKNLILTLNTSSYFASSSYINLYGGTVVLNTDAGGGSSATINGDEYTTVEFRTNTGNGIGSGGSIYCGTIKVFNDVSFGANTTPTLSSVIMKKIQFFNNSSLYSNLTVANGCFVEFYDDSNITNSCTLTLGDDNTAIAKFFHRSFIDSSCTISNGSHVEMTDYTSNNGTIGSSFAFLSGWSANEGTISNDASFNGRSENNGDISGSASFGDWSMNTGNITGDAVFNDFSKHSTGGSAFNAYYMGPLSPDGGADSSSYYPAWS